MDPLKEITAYEKAVQMRIKSKQSIIRENYGDDPWDVWDEIDEEEKELAARGLSSSAGAGVQVVPTADGGVEAVPGITPASGSAGAGAQKQAAAVAAASGDVQATALNGAQVAALVQIVQAVAQGQIPLETGKAIAKAAFPLIADAELDAAFAPLKSFTPTQPEPAQPSQA